MEYNLHEIKTLHLFFFRQTQNPKSLFVRFIDLQAQWHSKVQDLGDLRINH